jgi:hypothetical protein
MTRRPVDLDRDHARPRTAAAPTSEAIAAQLDQLVSPIGYALGARYRALGLRSRVLTLPVMLAVVLTIVWRQVASISDMTRLMAREGLFHSPVREISQQALSLRLRVLPAGLFAAVLHELLPQLQARSAARTRPRPAVLVQAQRHFPQIWAVDGSTLEAVFKKVGLLRATEGASLGGTICALLDVVSKLPVTIWFDPTASGNDHRFRDRIMAAVPERTLLLMDRGFYAFPFFDWFTDTNRAFLTPARSLAAYTTTTTLASSPALRDQIIALGAYRSNPCAHPVRLLEVRIGTTWHRYLTNVLDPDVLAPQAIVELYGRRWRIEEAFGTVKRLLGLSYLWSGSANAIALQVWASWIMYAVLVDLTDAVAAELDQPLEALSLEMVYRGLAHYCYAAAHGLATDPVAYLAAQTDLGIVKRRRPKRDRDRLDKLPPELKV